MRLEFSDLKKGMTFWWINNKYFTAAQCLAIEDARTDVSGVWSCRIKNYRGEFFTLAKSDSPDVSLQEDLNDFHYVLHPLPPDVFADEPQNDKPAIVHPEPVQPDIYRPDYYNSGKIKLSDFIKDKGFGFFDGLAIKYIVRAGKKPGVDPVSDYKKAIESLQFKIEQIEDQRGSK